MDGKTVGIIATLFFLVGGFAIFVNTMPSEFFLVASTPDYETGFTNYPKYWTREDIQNYPFALNKTVSIGGTNFDFSEATPSYDILLKMYWYSTSPIFTLRQVTGYSWPLGIEQGPYLEWENLHPYPYVPYGIPYLTTSDIVNRFDDELNVSCFSPVDIPTFGCVVWFADTNSSRNDIEQSLIEGSVIVQIAFGYSNVTQTYDVWSLTGKLLTFQAPEIFGGGNIGVLLNAMIALPLWGAIAALIAMVILEIIPF